MTAAATGEITGAVIVLGRRSLIDLPTVLIAVVTLVFLWKFKQKLPEPVMVLVTAGGWISYLSTYAFLKQYLEMLHRRSLKSYLLLNCIKITKIIYHWAVLLLD